MYDANALYKVRFLLKTSKWLKAKASSKQEVLFSFTTEKVIKYKHARKISGNKDNK